MIDPVQFRQDAKLLFKKFGLESWKFEWANTRRRFGRCSYSDKTIEISIVLALLNSEAEVMNTLLHEIAHALTPGKGHDSTWKSKAVEIGCTGNRCYSSEDVKQIVKYIGQCGCKIHKRDRPCLGRRKCLKCGSLFEFRLNDVGIV